jgi:hypothetical protein
MIARDLTALEIGVTWRAGLTEDKAELLSVGYLPSSPCQTHLLSCSLRSCGLVGFVLRTCFHDHINESFKWEIVAQADLQTAGLSGSKQSRLDHLS